MDVFSCLAHSMERLKSYETTVVGGRRNITTMENRSKIRSRIQCNYFF
jgi:hypothetical protein